MSITSGYRWLAHHYGLEPAQPFLTPARLPSTRPADTLAGHLTFAFKYEGVHLECLSRLFVLLPAQELEVWLAQEPSGQYARRAGFFYEWLTGQRLAFAGVTVGNYVDSLNPQHYFTAHTATNNPRWRVRDNLLGTAAYCPLIRRTAAIQSAETYDCAQHLQHLEQAYGEDLLMRSAVWLTVKESLASFTLEHEGQQTDRVQRFAVAMERYCGQAPAPLAADFLTALQREILGDKATRYGLRRSPVFVGEVQGFLPVVHYIAPHWDDTPALLAGLANVEQRTRGQASVLRAALLAFGFVYLHPLVDGNGRVSRFLVNDILRRDGVIPAPYILPVSATINRNPAARRAYDQALEAFSRPLMQRYRGQYAFGEEQEAADGVRYNLHFHAYADALHAWRYPDLTAQTEYLAGVVAQTLEQEMREEAVYLQTMRQARLAIKALLEAPDTDIDRIIRSIRENPAGLSRKIQKEYPLLQDPAVGAAVVAVVRRYWSD